MVFPHTTCELEIRTWAEPLEMNIKIEQGLNLVIDNDSWLFFYAQEA